jgi:hypothetical protein
MCYVIIVLISSGICVQVRSYHLRSFIVVSDSTMVGTQDLTLAKQVFYHLSFTPSPFSL